MGLFGLKGAGGWEAAMAETMTEEELAKMEREGYDVSSIRAKRTELADQEEAGSAAFAERRRATAVPTDLDRLLPYRSTPRSTESGFFKDTAGKPPIFGREKWKERLANAPLIYGMAVQANSGLWLPGRGEFLPAVFVFALDSAHIYNTDWLAETAKAISEMKEKEPVPADCREFIEVLRDDQSEFCFPLGSTLVGGADAWCVTYKFDRQTILPGNRLPEDGVMPFLLEARPQKQIPIQMLPVPGKYYQA